MCGIIGALGPSATELAKQMPHALACLQHRGPDDSGIYLSPDGQCVLGHRRLSILDLSPSAHQPMQRDQHVLVFNGELYNHQVIRQLWLSPQTPFQSHSDTETMLRLLQQHGTSVLHHVVGMFAAAYYDENKQTLTLFRDGLGIKPLYTLQLPDGTRVFSSEIKGLQALLPDWQATLNAQAVSVYLQFENLPQGCSLFAGVSLQPPGRLLTWRMQNGGVTETQATLPSFPLSDVPPTDDAELIVQTRQYLEESVQWHLMSDVPLGVYLSGGVDSSLVASMATRYAQGLEAFTGYFQTADGFYDERPVSRAVAQHLGIPLHEVCITPSDFKTYFDDVMWALDEPRMGMGTFSQFMVAKTAGLHRKVILAGHGGDELFGGYPLFKAFWLMEAGFSSQALEALWSLKSKEWPWVLDAMSAVWRYRHVRFAPQLYTQLAQRFDSPDVSLQASFVQAKSPYPLAQLTQYYEQTYLPGLLTTEDKLSMAHSLETRVPLWSQKLIAWVNQIPIQQKVQQGQLKALLKKIARPYLPDAVFTAPKRGFPTPLRLWFRDELYDWTRSRLLDASNPLLPFISAREIETLLHQHKTQKRPFALDERRAHRIWMLLSLESWMRQYGVRPSVHAAASVGVR